MPDRRSGRTLVARTCGWAALALLLTLATPTLAQADLVEMTSGRVMSVFSCEFDGDTAIITLREGGEIRFARGLIARVLPDEVSHDAPKAAAAALVSSIGAATWTFDAVHALVDRMAAKVGVDGRLAQAVVRTESNYDLRALSPKGAMGLMQIMPDLAQEYAVQNPYDPEKNLEAGLRYLRSLVDKLGLTKGLAAYNAGEGAVSRYGGVPPFPETQNYVKRVLALVR